VTANPTGGDGAIAIVDAFDFPTAEADLDYFSTQFGLPKAHFKVVYASGTQPPQDPSGGWEIEEALDIEWAHAMAPHAKIFLVEADSNSFADLLTAELVAGELVKHAGGGEVSNSWGGGEFPEEVLYDAYFHTPGVVYFASTGDGPGVIWPSTSPNVVAAGGTSISRNPFTGSFIAETAWVDTGGGVSEFEPRPGYQDDIASIVGPARGVPDLSFDANPTTGVWVYDSTPFEGFTGWWIVGGTSVSSPSLAGIVNSAGKFRHSSYRELVTIYDHLGSHAFNDTTLGYCGPYAGYWTSEGWDPCTGVGSVNGKSGK
jgi:kumamolisin